MWRDPRAGSQTDPSSFEHLARTAERGLMDFFFLAEGLRLREQGGKIYDLDVVGRPDTLTVLNSLAAVTTHLGLAGTINATFNEAAEVARQFASLDHLSGGRAAWNVVTSSDAFTGENFRRGGYLAHADRYVRAREVLDVAREFWDSWGRTPSSPTRCAGSSRATSARSSTTARSSTCAVRGCCRAARRGTRSCSRPATPTPGASSARRTRTRSSRCTGRWRRVDGSPPTCGPGPSAAAARATTCASSRGLVRPRGHRGGGAGNAREIRFQQVGPQQAVAFLEQAWGRDLTGFDPEGPLPADDPDPTSTIVQGRARSVQDRFQTVREWRDLAAANGWSARELVVEVSGRQQFVGTPEQVAAEIDAYVQADACDGFILVPHLTPTGLDEFVDRVVPLLQERGSYRTQYTGTTLREHLGLRHPHRTSGTLDPAPARRPARPSPASRLRSSR